MAIFSQANTKLGLFIDRMTSEDALSYCLPGSPVSDLRAILPQRGVEHSCKYLTVFCIR